jgi:phosphate transport system permease protein
MENESTISRPPTGLEKFFNISFRVSAYAFGWLTVVVVLYVIGKISWDAVPAMQEHGLGFITGRTWDANTGEYGILPEIWGTLYSSVLALIIGTLFGVSVAIFLAEGFFSGFVFWVLKFFGLQYHSVFGKLPDALEQLLKNLIELLAAIPASFTDSGVSSCSFH